MRNRRMEQNFFRKVSWIYRLPLLERVLVSPRKHSFVSNSQSLTTLRQLKTVRSQPSLLYFVWVQSEIREGEWSRKAGSLRPTGKCYPIRYMRHSEFQIAISWSNAWFAMANFISKGHIVGNFLSISIVNSLREISRIVLCQCHADIATDLSLVIRDYITSIKKCLIYFHDDQSLEVI